MAEKRTTIRRKLGAYALAAGVVAGAGAQAGAAMQYYNNGGAGWFDDRPGYSGGYVVYDQILLKLDGAVLVDDVQIDPVLPSSPSIEFKGEFFVGEYYWGGETARDTAFLKLSDAGVVGYLDGKNTPEASKLGPGETVDADSYFVTGDVGLYGYGWYMLDGDFRGRGYLGFYIEDAEGDRHYGWADVTIAATPDRFGPSPNEVTLHEFAISDEKNMGVVTGGGEVPEPATLSLLALGAVGLTIKRQRK
jgi:hypothetical protein